MAFHTHAVSGKNPSLRERLAFYIDSSSTGRSWEVFDLLINGLFVLIYVYNTSFSDGDIPIINHQVDTFLAALLLIQWIPMLWLALDPDAIFSLMSIMSWLATVPVLFVYAVRPFWPDEFWGTFLDAGSIGLFYPFRFWRYHLTLMKVVRPREAVRHVTPVAKAFSIGCWIFGLLITVTSFVHFVERHSNATLDFFSVFYWIFVTAFSGLSTKIVNDDWVSRLVIVYVMIAGVVFLPPAHIVLVGELEVTAVKDFLREFYCEDHGPSTMTTHVVMMNPAEPSEELRELLADPLYSNRVTYVKGSTLSAHDLQKAKVGTARAGFVLSSDYNDKDPAEVDALTVMRALSLKRFCKELKLFVQVLLPQNKQHFDSLAEHVYCLDELKLGVLAQNAVAPGFTALINVLITSIPEASIRTFQRNFRVGADGRGQWVKEYVEGASMEIYPVVLSKAFAGLTFREAAERFYLRHSIILFALASPNNTTTNTTTTTTATRTRLTASGAIASDTTTSTTSTSNRGEQDTSSTPAATPVRRVSVNPSSHVLRGHEIAYVVARNAFVAETAAAEAEWLYEPPRNGHPMEWDNSWEVRVDRQGPDDADSDSSDSSDDGAPAKGLGGVLKKVAKRAGGVGKRIAGAVGKFAPSAGTDTATPTPGELVSGSEMENPVPVSVIPEVANVENAAADNIAPAPHPIAGKSAAEPRLLSARDVESTIAADRISLLSSIEDSDDWKATGDLVFMGGSADIVNGGDGNGSSSRYGMGSVDELENPELALAPSPVIDENDEEEEPFIAPPVAPPPKPNFFGRMFRGPRNDSSGSSPAPSRPSTDSADTVAVQPSDPSAGPAALPPTNHIIICSFGTERFPGNLVYLIAPIRRRAPDLPILVLAPVEPDTDELATIMAYRGVTVVKGTPLVRADLKKVGVEAAAKAIVLANPTKLNMSQQNADAPALLSVLNIEAMSKNGIFINIEVLHPVNMKFIGNLDERLVKMDLYGQMVIPALVSGHIFCQSMLHTLLVQTYYNPHLLVILKHWLFPTTNPASTNGSSAGPRAIRTGSASSSSSSMGALFPHDQMFKVRIPRRYHGLHYEQLVVRALRDCNAVCLGLYRREEADGLHDASAVDSAPAASTSTALPGGRQSKKSSASSKSGSAVPGRKSVVMYVVVNPAKDIKLRRGDAAFMLAATMPALS
ncbi:hypothetical protein DFJ73DRAFT_854405 [Zopfochytrium polystomum]|nr:hypothetical protein DFJ73DRAFT_854405 [Zopfochytrium polystomum]